MENFIFCAVWFGKNADEKWKLVISLRYISCETSAENKSLAKYSVWFINVFKTFQAFMMEKKFSCKNN